MFQYPIINREIVALGAGVLAAHAAHLGMLKELVGQDGRIAWAAAHSAWGRVVEIARGAPGRAV